MCGQDGCICGQLVRSQFKEEGAERKAAVRAGEARGIPSAGKIGGNREDKETDARGGLEGGNSNAKARGGPGWRQPRHFQQVWVTPKKTAAVDGPVGKLIRRETGLENRPKEKHPIAKERRAEGGGLGSGSRWHSLRKEGLFL